MTSTVLLAKTSPSFLRANSTSHTWAFSAIAELIDNAYDPDVHASVLRIDVEHVMVDSENITCITFTDDGSGMSPEKLHNMLSFGYCEKVEMNGYKPVGQYGNGFKSGSMRLGKDAIVFTKNETTLSVGFLSQTYLEHIKAETIFVPILSWDRKTMQLLNKLDTGGSLRAIRGHSIFKSTAAILREFDHIIFETGTRIIIYNLKRFVLLSTALPLPLPVGLDGKLELDIESDHLDIINSEHHEMDAVYRPVIEYTPEYRRSLREYCSILFLKSRMKIILRDKKVKSKLVIHSLKRAQVDTYKPRFLAKPVKIVFGFSPTQDFGIIFYHRNRLIKAYEKVGCQRQNSIYGSSSAGIVGVVEADFLEPIHNKQEFDRTDRYNSFINALGQKLNDYREFINRQDGQDPLLSESVNGGSDSWTWAQCDRCNKWRRLPIGCEGDLPDVWFCYMNRDPAHNRCDIDEEPEDEDAIMQQSINYTKIVKKQRNMDQIEKTQRKKEQEETFENRTRADLEKARLQLEEAQRREASQLRIIEMLQKENQQWKDKQRKLSNGIMSDSQCMANLNGIARRGTCGSPKPVPPPNEVVIDTLDTSVPRKRKSSTKMETGNKKSRQSDRNSDKAEEEVEDDKDAVRTSLVIKLPGSYKQTATIVIDDSSDSDYTQNGDTAEDVKPVTPTAVGQAVDKPQPIERLSESESADIKPLTSPENPMLSSPVTGSHTRNVSSGEVVCENPAAGCTQTPAGKKLDSHRSKRGSSSVGNLPKSVPVRPWKPTVSGDLPSPSQPHSSGDALSTPYLSAVFNNRQEKQRKSKSVHRGIPTCHSQPHRTVAVQTDSVGDTDSGVYHTLQTLRGNVLRLLKSIVPTLDDFGNLEFVDNVVVEMVRVSNTSSTNRPTSTDDVKLDEAKS